MTNLSAHFLEKKDIILPCPFGPPFLALAVCVDGAELVVELVVLGLVGGGGSSSEKDSQPASWIVTAATWLVLSKRVERPVFQATYQDIPGRP